MMRLRLPDRLLDQARGLYQMAFNPRLVIRRRFVQLYEGETSQTQQFALKWVEWGAF